MGLIDVTYLVPDDARTFVVGSCEGDNFEKEFDQILSTFKFTN
jgi:hypothetical protein